MEQADELAALPDDERDAKAQRAFRMRSSATPWNEIADELGVSLAAAQVLATHAAGGRQVPDRRESLVMELDRLDRWQHQIEADIAAGVGKPGELVAAALRISERRAKYLGLDAATEVNVNVGVVEQAHLDLAALLLEHAQPEIEP